MPAHIHYYTLVSGTEVSICKAACASYIQNKLGKVRLYTHAYTHIYINIYLNFNSQYV